MNALKTVVITGAGSGLGRELAKIFVSKGYMTIGFGRTESKLQETKSEITTPDKFDYQRLDVTDYSAVNTAVNKILSQFGKIDLLINNAALYEKQNFIDESPSVFAQAIQANIIGISNCCKAVLPSMISNKSGMVINVGSWAHKKPIAKSASYSASKGAVHSLTKAIATDTLEKSNNISFIEWIPGHMNTQMSEFTGMAPEICANWCGEIVEHESLGNHTIFEGNQIWEEPLSLKQKIKKKILGRK